MDTAILNKYNVSFLTKRLNNRLVKDMSSLNDLFDQFITDHRDKIEAITLRDGILNVMSGVVEKAIAISPTLLTAEVTLELTKFYEDPEYDSSTIPFISIPTNDFKSILESWIEYL
jgi:hypothetical protein